MSIRRRITVGAIIGGAMLAAACNTAPNPIEPTPTTPVAPAPVTGQVYAADPPIVQLPTKPVTFKLQIPASQTWVVYYTASTIGQGSCLGSITVDGQQVAFAGDVSEGVVQIKATPPLVGQPSSALQDHTVVLETRRTAKLTCNTAFVEGIVPAPKRSGEALRLNLTQLNDQFGIQTLPLTAGAKLQWSYQGCTGSNPFTVVRIQDLKTTQISPTSQEGSVFTANLGNPDATAFDLRVMSTHCRTRTITVLGQVAQ